MYRIIYWAKYIRFSTKIHSLNVAFSQIIDKSLYNPLSCDKFLTKVSI